MSSSLLLNDSFTFVFCFQTVYMCTVETPAGFESTSDHTGTQPCENGSFSLSGTMCTRMSTRFVHCQTRKPLLDSGSAWIFSKNYFVLRCLMKIRNTIRTWFNCRSSSEPAATVIRLWSNSESYRNCISTVIEVRQP